MDMTFALDIGTRSIIGMVGTLDNEKVNIVAIEREEHANRAMIDGQIEDIGQVVRVAAAVKERLEKKVGCKLTKVHVAAAGRALKTQSASYELELASARTVDEETIRQLEAGAIDAAEKEFEKEGGSLEERQFYLAGYSVRQYYLDHYPISSLKDHRGRVLSADVIATFLPREVVESLYACMNKAGLEVGSLTLEPIASMNAAIPQNLRLLNLALVDIGAGTSDIAVARDGSVFGYTMATVAGDEVTEHFMKTYLVDFSTAEFMKFQMEKEEPMTYKDVLGFEHKISAEELLESSRSVVEALCRQISEKIMEINQTAPSAVFLVGGGSKMAKVREYVSEYLEMDENRVALGGNNFSVSAFSDEYDLNDPEYSTPLGIAISAALNLISDSFNITLNGSRAKLFRNGRLTILDVLMMNGYNYRDIMGRSGQALVYYLDGQRMAVRGDYASPSEIFLNGSPAKLTDVIHAGDKVDFEPAKSGEEKKLYLRDVVREETDGEIHWKDGSIPLGCFAKVNGERAFGTREIEKGDRIRTCVVETVEDFIKYTGIKDAVTVNGDFLPGDVRLKDQDVLEEIELTDDLRPMYEAFQLPESVKQAAAGLEDPEVLEETGTVGEAPDARESREPGDSAGEAALGEQSSQIRLNGKSIYLAPKEDGDSYYLMDMLTRLDFDLSKPNGVIVLKVNGESAEFQTELKNGDAVDIYWSKDARSS